MQLNVRFSGLYLYEILLCSCAAILRHGRKQGVRNQGQRCYFEMPGSVVRSRLRVGRVLAHRPERELFSGRSRW